MDNARLFHDDFTEQDISEIRQLPGPIAVIGASGFIGSKLFFTLRKHRQDVFAISRYTERSWRLLQLPTEQARRHCINLDIAHPSLVNKCLELHKFRTVFNLAAYGAYERQNESHKIYSVNFMGTMNLLCALFEYGCDAFVQAGSSSEYGLNCQGPAESAELSPNSDYAVSKGSASLLIKYYGRIKRFPCVNLRLYSIYGPWEERDRLIPRVVIHGRKGLYPPFVDKRISRDFVYVDDCLRALIKSALTICKTDPGSSINIASGIKTSLEDVSRAAQKVFQIPTEPVFSTMPNRKWDLQDWYGDPAWARAQMGWEARVSFEAGLRLTAQWEEAAENNILFGTVPVSGKTLSAVIACYRDQLAIPIMYERLTKMFQAQGVEYEIIFVNDHSPNEDELVISQLCARDHHVIGISHSRNFGSQSAFLSGMEVATGDAVILLDGDLQDPPELIPQFIQAWEAGNQIVFGVRVQRKASWYMQILYKLFYRIFKQLADVSIPLDAGDFSLLDRKVVDQLTKFSEKDIFLRGLRAWIGFKQTGIPYVRPERMFGKSTNNFMKNIWWAKKAIFSFSIKPLEYIQRLSVLLFLGSLGLALFYFINYFFHPPEGARGVTTIVLLMLGLGSVQLFSLSILGDYLGKILEEVKNRPHFIRARIFKGHEVMESPESMTEFIRTAQEDAHGEYHR